MTYTIGEASTRTGLTISQIRFYDKEGLTPFVERNESGIRKFSDGDIQFLGIITCLKDSGVPIKKIKQFVDWAMEGDSTIDDRLNFMREQKVYLQEQMKELKKNMKIVEGKIKYYEIAAEAGTTAVHDTKEEKVVW